MNRRDLILVNVSDLIANFLYYDRKGDEELVLGDIEKAIEAGEVSVDEIIARFTEELKKHI
ncbi:MAG: hypothetical protein M0R80_01915 [Proteobacteria bacterium]|nr:hypothetical protein [Pseudomonadota bacterium]